MQKFINERNKYNLRLLESKAFFDLAKKELLNFDCNGENQERIKKELLTEIENFNSNLESISQKIKYPPITFEEIYNKILKKEAFEVKTLPQIANYLFFASTLFIRVVSEGRMEAIKRNTLKKSEVKKYMSVASLSMRPMGMITGYLKQIENYSGEEFGKEQLLGYLKEDSREFYDEFMDSSKL